MRTSYDKYDKRLLDVCAELHADACGSGDALSDDERRELIAFLQMRLDTWIRIPSKPNNFAYDYAVASLVAVAIQEARSPMVDVPNRCQDEQRQTEMEFGDPAPAECRGYYDSDLQVVVFDCGGMGIDHECPAGRDRIKLTLV